MPGSPFSAKGLKGIGYHVAIHPKGYGEWPVAVAIGAPWLSENIGPRQLPPWSTLWKIQPVTTGGFDPLRSLT
jgi:hypothetical protein